MATSAHITRRSALIGALVSSAAIAVPAASLAAKLDGHADHRLVELMTEWQVQIGIANKDYDDVTVGRLSEIEDEASAILPQTAAGFAIKLLMLTAYGDYVIDGTTSAACLYPDAIKLSGFPVPSGYAGA